MTTAERSQDERVLVTAARLLDGTIQPQMVPFPVEGLTDAQVIESVRRLARAQPPYFVAEDDWDADYPTMVRLLTERGMREGGIWPTPDSVVDQLAALLQALGETAPPEEKRAIRKTLTYLTQDGRAVAASVMATIITGGSLGG